MGAGPREFSEVDRNVAANVRQVRERRGLSQEELARQMSDRGFGFSQATVWKIESGQRTVKISEAVALADVLEMITWRDLTADPGVARHELELEKRNRICFDAYAALKRAATTYLEAQVQAAYAVYKAEQAGVAVHILHKGWLDTPVERAVLEARVEYQREDEVLEQHYDEVNALLDALREHGYGPLRTQDIVTMEGAGEPDDSR